MHLGDILLFPYSSSSMSVIYFNRFIKNFQEVLYGILRMD